MNKYEFSVSLKIKDPNKTQIYTIYYLLLTQRFNFTFCNNLKAMPFKDHDEKTIIALPDSFIFCFFCAKQRRCHPELA
jgi:hypothetical protein